MTPALPAWLEEFRTRLDAEVIETHISWLLLADGCVWKLKKPLSLPFLDYGSQELRHFFCREEIRLNRRLAPELYLGLEPIGDSGEWAVKMRRFPESQRLDRVCARGMLTPAHLSALARVIHAFHAGAATAPPTSRFGEPAQVLAPALDNFAELAPRLPAEGARLARLQNWTAAEFARIRPCLAARKAGGYIRECHGDLHLGNLVLLNGEILPFDCIEFNEDFRWIDVASELAFTYVDLLDHRRPDLAAWLLNEWLAGSGDFEAVPVLRFYAVYKAMVRTKVAAFSGQPEIAAGYLGLAEHLAMPPPPRLVITHGLSGSGKTTCSGELLRADPAAACLRLRSDLERKRLFGLPPLAPRTKQVAERIHTPEATARTFARIAAAAGAMLDAGWSVIVDAAFLRAAERAEFQQLAARHRATFAILACAAPFDELCRRVLARRGDASDATLAVLERQRGWLEPLSPAEQALTLAMPRLPPLAAARRTPQRSEPT